MIRRRLTVHGRVQGVGFRYSLARRAESRGVVESLVRWCEQGPPGASVDRVDVTEEEPQGVRGFATR